MIKKIVFHFSLFYSMAVAANSNIPLNVLKVCLFQHSSIEGGDYSPVDISAVLTDGDYSSSGEVHYAEYNGSAIGYGASQSGMAFYKGTKPYPLSKSKVIEVGLPIKIVPEEIDYAVSEWGSIKLNKRDFICVNVPFSGIGESGQHQDIRNVFVYDIKGNDIYYTVGNVRGEIQ